MVDRRENATATASEPRYFFMFNHLTELDAFGRLLVQPEMIRDTTSGSCRPRYHEKAKTPSGFEGVLVIGCVSGVR
jgi:hypothetical protein